MNENEIIKFDTIDTIREYNTWLTDKINNGDDLSDVDYQNLSLSHRQNAGRALSAQLVTGCGYSPHKADSIAHSSCKMLTTYLQLRIEGLTMSYPEFWHLACERGWVREYDAYMLVKTSDVVQGFPDLELTVNEIDDWKTFLNSDIPYGQVRINVTDGDGSYSHSLPSYCINGEARRIADVSYRTQGAIVVDLIKAKDFKYFLYLV